MKADVARLLRVVLRLVEDDVRELADAVVEIDEREAAHHAEVSEYATAANLYGIDTRDSVLSLEERVVKLEQRAAALSLLSRDTGRRTTTLERRLIP